MIWLHIRQVWSNHGSYFGKTVSQAKNAHGKTKQAFNATEAYQKGAILGFYCYAAQN